MFVFLGVWVTKLGADIVDVSFQCSSTRSFCVAPYDVNAREFGTCPISGDSVVFAERHEEMFSMDPLHVFNTKIIHK
jgi:hypothetical protein